MAEETQVAESIPLSQKLSGAYFTPDDVVTALVRWAIRRPTDRMLDPACGDGRFLAAHRKSVGIEQDQRSAAIAMERAPWALVHEGDFFSWASNTKERFECAAGNPPFIRYQHFNGEIRARALALCAKLGAHFSGLSSSWAPFLVAAAGLLKPGGRISFVVPAELGHAPYARPLLEFLLGNFRRIHVVAVRDKLFPELSEDCWLLYADGYGGKSSSLELTVVNSFIPTNEPPPSSLLICATELRDSWKMRLRPYVLPAAARESYLQAGRKPESFRLSDVANVGIGYVSGDNDFFHFRPSLARSLRIPKNLLHPTVRNGRVLPPKKLTQAIVDGWLKADEPVLLLRLQKTTQIPAVVRRYLDSEAGQKAREAFKCRTREPWYAVPDVKTPNFFMTYMSGLEPGLVRNDTDCTCTNSVHSVRFTKPEKIAQVQQQWTSPFVQLSCELEGHPLGGGMLKLEPREAGQILIPESDRMLLDSGALLNEAVSTMRQWRHYAAN